MSSSPQGVSALDIVTLVLAILGVLTGIASLLWQAITFFLSGSRGHVELQEAWIGPVGAWTGAAGTWLGRTPPAPGYDQEHLAVRVQNRGRLPLSVSSWGIKIGPTELSHSQSLWNKPLPHRLEVGEEATWFADRRQVDAILPAVAKSTVNGHPVGDPVTIQATARFGHGRHSDSKAYIVDADGTLRPRPRPRRRLFFS